MKYKFIPLIIIALIFGYLCASFVISNYNTYNVFDSIIYYLQVGVYNNLDNSNDDLKNIKNKITIKENNKYYSYIGMTSSISLAEKIKKLYSKQNIDVYIKKENTSNISFYNQLVQYDILLKSSDNIDEINSVLKTILASYEESLNSL